jgi:hypothetical protein
MVSSGGSGLLRCRFFFFAALGFEIGERDHMHGFAAL